MATSYRTAPDPAFTGWPRSVPFIIGNEGCERFSFYGMKSILYVYLAYLYTHIAGMAEEAATNEATAVVHLFIAGVYALPMLGAIVADRLAGKYNTIFWLSLVYCGGHAALAIFENNLPGTYLGLALIAIGSGGIKPCVSANVGDQFGKGNWHRVGKVFQAFYFIINFGSFFATLLIPWLKETYGWSVAFGVPGILMGLATLVFWAGRKQYVHVPAQPGGRLGLLDALGSTLLFMTVGSLFFTAGLPGAAKVGISIASLVLGFAVFAYRQRIQPDDGFLAVMVYSLRAYFTKTEDAPLPSARMDQPRAVGADAADSLASHAFFGPAVRRFGQEAAEGPLAVLKILSVFLLVSLFWALFDQHSSSWIEQAKHMDRHFDLPLFGRFELLAEQTTAVNPILVMLLIPICTFGLYPLLGKLGFAATPLRRMTIGMLIAGFSFVVVALLQQRLDAGESVHVGWQFVAYGVITLAEVMVSTTGLEFAYTQAPRRMKSTIMGFWLLTVSLGNVLTAMLFSNFGGTMTRAELFWVFAALMGVAGVLFGVRAAFYRYKDYAQA